MTKRAIKPSPTLVNPEVAAHAITPEKVDQAATQPHHYRTHIPEPRWQQIVSVLVVGFFVGLWLWVLLRR